MSSIAVVALDDFGAVVARYLRRLHPDSVEVSERTCCLEKVCPADVVVLASGQPVADGCARLDAICRRDRRGLIPIVFDDAHLVVGPVVSGGEGACWSCWRTRQRQRDVQALDGAINTDHGAGVLHASAIRACLAASQASLVIHAMAERHDVAGALWRWKMDDAGVSRSVVVGVGGCRQCGLRERQECQPFSELRSALDFLTRT